MCRGRSRLRCRGWLWLFQRRCSLRSPMPCVFLSRVSVSRWLAIAGCVGRRLRLRLRIRRRRVCLSIQRRNVRMRSSIDLGFDALREPLHCFTYVARGFFHRGACDPGKLDNPGCVWYVHYSQPSQMLSDAGSVYGSYSSSGFMASIRGL